jgi:hypothetical protein
MTRKRPSLSVRPSEHKTYTSIEDFLTDDGRLSASWSDIVLELERMAKQADEAEAKVLREAAVIVYRRFRGDAP